MVRNLLQISVFSIAGLLILVFCRCSKPSNDASNIPRIAFDGYTVHDTFDSASQKYHNIFLNISFSDGDGDLGLDAHDTFPPFNPQGRYYFNIFVNYYERVQGKFIPMTNTYPFIGGDTINYNGRFPRLTPEGKHKAIQGVISYKLQDVRPRAGDQVKFEIWIYDRALHKSNVVESPGIVLN